jgi:hypothetical protein
MKAAAIGGGPMFSSMKRHTQGLLRVRSATLGGDRARVRKRRIHLRGGVGFGRVQEDTDSDSWELPFYGTALSGGLGLELTQSTHVAPGLEATGTAVHYPDQWWNSAGLDFTLGLC